MAERARNPIVPGRSASAGMVLLDKPEGISSFAALGALKRAFVTRQIGHTGTLDPFASGLMIALVGPFTKLSSDFTHLDKIYQVTCTFGTETDTLDPEGSIVAESPVPSLERIAKSIPPLTGSILQMPPAYSAIHVNGRRAYDIARSGGTVELAPRPVTIYSIELHEYHPPMLDITVACSSGTYIRSLVRDLGRASGSVAHVSRLRRTRVGPFAVEEAFDPMSLNTELALSGALDGIRRMPGIGVRIVDSEVEARLSSGRVLRHSDFRPSLADEGSYLLFGSSGALLAGIRLKKGKLEYRFVVPGTG